MDTIPCRGCGTILNLSDAGCPICLRGRSKYEITRDYAQLREDKSRRRRRPFVILGALLVLGAAGRMVFLHRERIARTYGRAHARVTRFMDEAGDPANYAPHPIAKSAAPDEPPAPAPAGGSPPTSGSAPAPEQKNPSAKAPPIEVPDLVVPAMEPNRWAVYGRVYDLKTLRPAGNVGVTFVHSMGGASYLSRGSVSDADGRYMVVFERSKFPGGYEAACNDARYLRPVFQEADIPYATLPAADRQSLLDSARSGDMHSTPFEEITGEDSRRLDLFLAPRQ